MANRRYPKPFLLGLIASLRQAALSLHRAESSEELRTYYRSGRLEELTMALSRLGEVDVEGASKRKSGVRFSSWVSWAISGAGTLPAELVHETIVTAGSFIDALEKEPQLSTDERNALRMRLDQCADNIGWYIPSSSLVADAQKVTHLGQAEHLNLKSVSEIAGAGWCRS